MKRTRILPVVLCVMVIAAIAALVWHRQTARSVLDPLLVETLSVSDQDQPSLADAVQTIDQTDRADGLTMTVKQAITYPQMLCLLVELTYPDSIDPAALPESTSVLPASSSVSVNGIPLSSYSSCILPAWDETNTGPTNAFPCLIRFLADNPFFAQGQTCTLTLQDFSLQSGAQIQLSWTTEALGEAIQIPLNGETITGNAVLTPLSLQVSGTSRTYDSPEALYRALSFRDKQGETLPLQGTPTGNAGHSSDSAASTITLKCHFSSYLPVEDCSAIQLGEEAFSLA